MGRTLQTWGLCVVEVLMFQVQQKQKARRRAGEGRQRGPRMRWRTDACLQHLQPGLEPEVDSPTDNWGPTLGCTES